MPRTGNRTGSRAPTPAAPGNATPPVAMVDGTPAPAPPLGTRRRVSRTAEARAREAAPPAQATDEIQPVEEPEAFFQTVPEEGPATSLQQATAQAFDRVAAALQESSRETRTLLVQQREELDQRFQGMQEFLLDALRGTSSPRTPDHAREETPSPRGRTSGSRRPRDTPYHQGGSGLGPRSNWDTSQGRSAAGAGNTRQAPEEEVHHFSPAPRRASEQRPGPSAAATPPAPPRTPQSRSTRPRNPPDLDSRHVRFEGGEDYEECNTTFYKVVSRKLPLRSLYS
jgi:hypothetical protein